MSYYEELGIPETATDEEIRAAYRRKAKQHHPDRGGDAAKMAQTNRAYETLIEPARRLTYDRTGEDRPERVDAIARDMLLGILLEWLNSDSNSGDMIRDVTARLNADRLNLTAQIAQGSSALAKLRKRMKKLKYRGKGPDLLGLLLNQKITGLKQQVEKLRDGTARIDRAKELLATYEYEVDPPAPTSPMFVFLNQ